MRYQVIAPNNYELKVRLLWGAPKSLRRSMLPGCAATFGSFYCPSPRRLKKGKRYQVPETHPNFNLFVLIEAVRDIRTHR